MKHHYLLIHSSGEITTETVFYHVWIGDGAADQILCEQFENIAAENSDFYFKRWSDIVARFYSNIADSLFPNKPNAMLLLLTKSLSASDMRHVLKESMMCKKEVETNTPFRMLQYLDPRFYLKNHTAIRTRKKPKAIAG